MKRVIVVLAVLVFGQTVHALDIWCEFTEPNEVTIKYSGAGGENPVRGFALDIWLGGDGTFSNITCLSHQFGYHIYPGSIQVDAGGNVTDLGSCKCSGSYPGTFDEPNAMTIEMASAYEEGVDPDPCDAGDHVSFIIDGPYFPEVIITVNAIRGGIVNEDATTTTPAITDCWPWPPPTCWQPEQCAGQSLGDATCDGSINAVDVFRLKQSWLKKYGDAGYNCCANFNHDAMGVNAIDLFRLKQNWLTTGLLPATGNQDCPDPEVY